MGLLIRGHLPRVQGGGPSSCQACRAPPDRRCGLGRGLWLPFHTAPSTLATLDAAAHPGAFITSRSPSGGILLEVRAPLVRHEHLRPQLSVLIALSAHESLGHICQAARRCAPSSIPAQRLAEDEFVGYGPYFVRHVFRSRSGLRKVDIAE